MPTISVDDRELLHTLAKSLSEEMGRETEGRRATQPKNCRPGDIFNQIHSQDIPDMLKIRAGKMLVGWPRVAAIGQGRVRTRGPILELRCSESGGRGERAIDVLCGLGSV